MGKFGGMLDVGQFQVDLLDPLAADSAGVPFAADVDRRGVADARPLPPPDGEGDKADPESASEVIIITDEDREKAAADLPKETPDDKASDQVEAQGLTKAQARRAWRSITKAFQGDKNAENGLNNYEREALKVWRKELARQVAEATTSTYVDPSEPDLAPIRNAEEAYSYSEHDRLIQLARDNFEEFEAELQRNDNLNEHFAAMVAYKKTLGLGSFATSKDVRRRMKAALEQSAGQTARRVSEAMNPDAVYASFQARPEWETFTDEQKDELDPVEFDGDDDIEIARAMERKYGAVAAAATASKPTPVNERVQKVQATAQKAQAAAAASPPVRSVNQSGARTMTVKEAEAEYARLGTAESKRNYVAAMNAVGVRWQ